MKNLALNFFVTIGLATYAPASHSASPKAARNPTAVPKGAMGFDAQAELIDAHGKSLGEVTFVQNPKGAQVKADLKGLPPGGTHALHVHEGFECTPPYKTAGEHFNPQKKPHGGPHGNARHPGDFGNIRVGKDGTAHLDTQIEEVTLGQGTNSIVGHAIVLHAKADDLKSQPAGDSGDRIACGIINAPKDVPASGTEAGVTGTPAP